MMHSVRDIVRALEKQGWTVLDQGVSSKGKKIAIVLKDRTTMVGVIPPDRRDWSGFTNYLHQKGLEYNNDPNQWNIKTQ